MGEHIAIVEGIYRPVATTGFLDTLSEKTPLLREFEPTEIQRPDVLNHFGQYNNPDQNKISQQMIVRGDDNIRDFLNVYEPSFELPLKVQTSRLRYKTAMGQKPRTGIPAVFDTYLSVSKDAIFTKERAAFKLVEGVEDKRPWHREILIGRVILKSPKDFRKINDLFYPYIPDELTLGKLVVDFQVKTI